jgi:hypothetical protein
MIQTGKAEVLAETPILITVFPPKIPHGLAWDRTNDKYFPVRGINFMGGAEAQLHSF